MDSLWLTILISVLCFFAGIGCGGITEQSVWKRDCTEIGAHAIRDGGNFRCEPLHRELGKPN